MAKQPKEPKRSDVRATIVMRPVDQDIVSDLAESMTRDLAGTPAEGTKLSQTDVVRRALLECAWARGVGPRADVEPTGGAS